MPTGEVVDMPDNPTPEQIASLAQINGSQQPQRSPLQSLGRSVGLAARMPLEAAGGTVGMVGDALNTAVNMGGEAIGHNPHLGMPSQAIQRGIDAITPTPEGTGEKVADFVGSTAAAGIKGGVDPLARAITSRLGGAAAKGLTARQQTIRDAQKAGYVVTPSQADGGMVGTALEAVGGKSKLLNSAQVRNQAVTDQLARKAAGLPDDTPLNHQTLSSAMESTYNQGYKPIEDLGRITTGGVYRKSLDKVLEDFQGASRSFPGAADNEVADLVKGYRVNGFDSKDAIGAIRNLRKNATTAYTQGKTNLAQAHRAIANSLEDNIELNLKDSKHPDASTMLDNYRSARTQLSKQQVVSDALQEGSGSVNALKIAAKNERTKGNLLTDELSTIGRFGNAAKPMAQVPVAQSNSGNNIGNIMQILSTIGAGLHNPAMGAAVGSIPMARWGLRRGILSPAGQAMLAPSARQLDPRILNALPTALTQSGLYGEQQ